MTPISAAAYYVLKRKGVEQQPPVKVVLVEVEFDYNAQTFVMAEVPRAMPIADLSQAQKEKIMAGWNHENRSDQVYTQVAVVSTKEFGNRFDTIFHIVLNENVLDNMNAAQIDIYRLRNECAQVRLKSDLFHGWKSIRRRNLQKQMKLGQPFTAFVQNVLQFFCNKSLQNTHRIMVNVKMEKEIGQISQLLDYSVVPIAAFKKCRKEVEKFVIHVEDNESKPLQCTDMAIETLILDFDVYFAFEYTVFCGVNVPQNKTAKQCKKAADKHFRKFQQLIKEMPADLLEKVKL